jgi:hypothetical protein
MTLSKLRATKNALLASAVACVAVGAVAGTIGLSEAFTRDMSSRQLSNLILIAFIAPAVGAAPCAAAARIETRIWQATK